MDKLFNFCMAVKTVNILSAIDLMRLLVLNLDVFILCNIFFSIIVRTIVIVLKFLSRHRQSIWVFHNVLLDDGELSRSIDKSSSYALDVLLERLPYRKIFRNVTNAVFDEVWCDAWQTIIAMIAFFTRIFIIVTNWGIAIKVTMFTFLIFSLGDCLMLIVLTLLTIVKFNEITGDVCQRIILFAAISIMVGGLISDVQNTLIRLL